MAMNARLIQWVEERGLDPEIGSQLGFDGTVRDGGECLVIPFFREGRIVRRKYRSIAGKKFSQDPGAPRCLWNEDVLRDDSLMDMPLIITEGEMDAWAAIQCGLLRTVSVPDGASVRKDDDGEVVAKYAWMDDVPHLLTRERCPEIIIASDNDEAGAQMLRDLALRFGQYRCKFLTYPKCPEGGRCKDLNDVLRYYGLKGVIETINRAQFVKVAGVYKMSELPPKPEARVFDIGFPAYGEHYRMRAGDFVVVTGTPSSGKTTFVQDMICRVVERYGIKVAWGSFEQDPQRDHKRNFRRWFIRKPLSQQTYEEKVAADQWIDAHHLFIVPDEEEDATLEWLVEKMELAVLRHGCEVIVVDPWNELDHLRDKHETQTEYVGRAIKYLVRFARRLGVHLIVVAHPTKMTRDKDGKYPEPTLYDISDSAHWYNKAVLGVVVHRENKDDTLIKTAKSKYHDIIGTPGSVIMQFCKDDGRFREMERR